MASRKRDKEIELKVLLQSRRRCCICYGLFKDLNIKQGQIAHLDRDASNTTENNLAFLCLDHHDQYDTKTSQSKSFQIDEVKHYRSELERYFFDNENEEKQQERFEAQIEDLSIKQINLLLTELPHSCTYCNYNFMLIDKLEPGVNVYIKNAKCPKCGNVDIVNRFYEG